MNSGVTMRLVASSATAFAPFSQNSANLRPPCSSGHAQPGQSKSLALIQPCQRRRGAQRVHLLQPPPQRNRHRP